MCFHLFLFFPLYLVTFFLDDHHIAKFYGLTIFTLMFVLVSHSGTHIASHLFGSIVSS